ncbi:MAG TPA: NADH-quinone oxidoreductase subunit N [Jiangellales bacterium]|nr:NADH-quinone oxidoreductase subunit N [Jiangellales bacterium]
MPGQAADRVVQSVDWAAIAPPVVVALTALAALLADLWLPRRARWVLTAGSVAGVAGALVAVGLLWGQARGTFCLPAESGTLPACSYVVNDVTLVFQAVVLAGTGVVLLLAAAEMREHDLPAGELHFLVLAATAGALTLAAARDLATLVVALEVVSLPAFALVGLRRGYLRGAEAALTFFLVSVVSVAVMLYGVGLVYGSTGHLHLDRVAEVLADPAARTPAATVGVLLTLVGLGFKIGAVPFHAWIPDTYAGAPVSVAAYLSVVSKAAGLVGLVVVVGQGFPAYADVWGPAVAVLAVLTMTVGNVGALRQRSAVRLLAWSSIAQAGYLLVPLGVASTGVTGARLGDALSATVAYLCIYAAVNLAAFGVVSVVARNRPAGDLADYRGLVRTEPASALALGFALLCLAGLPPGVAGLWAKVVVLDAAVSGGAGWLAVAVVVNTVIGLAYYLRWTALLFATPRDAVPPSYDVPLASGIAVGLAVSAGVLLSVLPQPVLGLATSWADLLG